ncbi:MAG: hypothetical protein AABY18_01265 [Candidatus Thermoplasmatota archaeon]
MQAPSDLALIRAKKARGEQLTDEERAKLRAYAARYYKRKKTVHIRGDRETEWMALAAAQGLSLSAWIQEQVMKGLVGNEEALVDIKAENQRLRDEIGSLRGTCGHLSVENSKLQSRLEGLEQNLSEALQQLLQLKGGAA